MKTIFYKNKYFMWTIKMNKTAVMYDVQLFRQWLQIIELIQYKSC